MPSLLNIGPIGGIVPIKRDGGIVPLPGGDGGGGGGGGGGGRGGSGTAATQASREFTVSAADGVAPCVYGTQRVGGKVFYVNTAGGVLYVAMDIAEGEIDSFVSVTLDGQASIAGVTVEAHAGASGQAVSALLSGAFGYTQTHPGRAYLVLSIAGTAKVEGIPQVLATIRGKKVYDSRLDSTNGGSGSHRQTDPSTWAYSQNLAVITRDVLTGAGRLGSSYLDEVSFRDGADYYDVTVDGEPRCAVNIACTSQTDVKSWKDTLCAHGAAMVVPSQGKYSFVIDKAFGTPLAPVASFDDSNIRAVKIARRNNAERPNRVILQWTDAVNDYVTATAIAETDAVTAGTEEPIETTVACPGITSRKLAERTVLYVLRRRTLSNLVISFTASPLAESVRIGDLVAISHRDLLAAQEAIVVAKADAGQRESNLTTEEYDSAVYSTAAVVVDTPPSIGLPDPMTPPPDVTSSAAATGYQTVSSALSQAGKVIVTTSWAWGLRYSLPSNSAVPLKALRLRMGATWGTNPASEIVVPLTGNTSKDTGQTQDWKLEVIGWVRQDQADTYYAAQTGSTDPITRVVYVYDPDVWIKVESDRGVLSTGVHVGGGATTTTTTNGTGAASLVTSKSWAYFWLGR